MGVRAPACVQVRCCLRWRRERKGEGKRRTSGLKGECSPQGFGDAHLRLGCRFHLPPRRTIVGSERCRRSQIFTWNLFYPPLVIEITRRLFTLLCASACVYNTRLETVAAALSTTVLHSPAPPCGLDAHLRLPSPTWWILTTWKNPPTSPGKLHGRSELEGIRSHFHPQPPSVLPPSWIPTARTGIPACRARRGWRARTRTCTR